MNNIYEETDHMIVWESENYRILYRRSPQNYEIEKAIGKNMVGEMQWKRCNQMFNPLVWEMVDRICKEVCLPVTTEV